MRTRLPFALLPALAVGACGGHAGQLEAREGSVHDALTSLGFPESGARSEASLGEGGTMQFPIHLEAGECRAFVAMGSGRIGDLDLDVLRSDGMRVARDENHGRDATAVYCASVSSEVEVVVTARRGHGEVVLGVYDASRAGRGSLGRSLGSSCEGAETITLGSTVSGDTSTGRHVMDGSCFEGNSPELYYRLEITAPTMVNLDLTSSYDGAVYVLRECGSPDGELGCNDDSGRDRRHSNLRLPLDPGQYVVVVDGYGGESGTFRLRVDGQPMAPLAQVCSEAARLVPGETLSTTTAGGIDRFSASCANGARSADRVSRLDLAERSRVRLVQSSPDHDGALFVRRACEDESSEVACNDDWNGIRSSVITRQLEAGSYFVYSDGFTSDASSAEGRIELRADVAPAAGSGTSSDSCTDAAALEPGSRFTVDTLQARDDSRGSCGGEGGADVVRRLRVATRSRVRLTLAAAQFNGVVYIRRGCGADAAEVMCRSFDLVSRSDGMTNLDATLEPGDYFVVFDGADVDSFGSIDVTAEITDLAAAQRACNDAPMLRSGREVSGTTAGSTNQFEASCAGQASSPDRLYRLQLTRRSFVSITLDTPDHDGALHMRRDCTDASTEVACNDDDPDVHHSRIEGNFDAGTYYVVVDGYANRNSGSFRLRADVSAARPDYRPEERPDAEDRSGGEELKPSEAWRKALRARLPEAD